MKNKELRKEVWKTFFKGKKITVIGLGLLGRGVGDVEFFAREGAKLIVTDLKTKLQLKKSLDKLKKYKNIRYTLGRHKFEDFENRDFVLKAAGVPLDSPYILHAKKFGVPVYMSTSLFAKMTKGIIVGVTGTRGKTTVAYMLYKILCDAHKGKKRKIFLGGNIQGMATLPLVSKVKKGDVAVLELDSWQLQGFGDMKISPQISVFTTFMPDHLNYYKHNLGVYFSDKANIFKNQKAGDVLIAGEQVKTLSKNLKRCFPKKTKFVSKQMLPNEVCMKIPGEHNKYNAAIAYIAARSLKISHKDIIQSLSSFKGASGRLEKITTANKFDVYNDTTSTTPEALKVALEALGKNRNIVLIMGGSDKMINLSILKKLIAKYVKSVFLIPGTGTDRMLKEKIIAKTVKIFQLKNFDLIVKSALDCAKKGDTTLFSPGFASFGMFKNEYDRGEKFVSLVQKYKKQKTAPR